MSSLLLLGAGRDAASSASFLVDTLSGGANIAFSTRKLRSAYAGSAITVRRSSDNTTQNIGFTGGGDLDTTSLSSFVGANDGFVTTWFDQSGNGVNATQTTAANQPKIVSAGTIQTLNGHAAAVFSSAGTTFLTFTAPGGAGGTAQPVSAIFPLRLTATAAGAHFTDTNAAADAVNRFVIGQTTGPVYTLYMGGSAPTGGSPDATTTHTLAAVINAASSTLAVDGTTVITGTSPGTCPLTTIDIGRGQGPVYMSGYIPEMIWQFASATAGDQSACRTSFQTYWGAA